jgi:hypothetical protein
VRVRTPPSPPNKSFNINKIQARCFEGTGTFPDVHPVTPSQENASGTKVTLTATHAFAKPGTYFAIVRATSRRTGQTETPFGRIQNIARVRVVVQ